MEAAAAQLDVSPTRDVSNRFPVARDILPKLDGWLAELAAPHLPAVRRLDPPRSFKWEFTEQSPATVQVAKAVRMISAVRAALLLADAGFTTEAASLLRIVGECHNEILAMSEALIEGRTTADQARFVEQFFAPLPQSPEEFERSERERYVNREDLFKAHRKLANRAAVDADEILRIARFLNKGFDTYVHAGYRTAMELYRGDTHAFMLSGTDSARARCGAQQMVALKLSEVLNALLFMALCRGMEPLVASIREERNRLEAANEAARYDCAGVRDEL